MKDHWLDDLQKRMANHEKSAPQGLWEDIEKVIDEKNSQKHQNNRRLLWSAKIGSIAAVLAITLLIGDKYWSTSSTSQQKHEEISMNSEREHQPKLIARQTSNKSYPSDKTKTLPRCTHMEDSIVVDVCSEKTNDKSENNNHEETKVSEKKSETYIPNRNYNAIVSSESNASRQYRDIPSKWDVAIYTVNVLQSTDNHQGYGNLSSVGATSDDEDVEERQDMTAIIVGNKYEETHTKMKHRQPIRVGVTVQYQLSNRLGIESGLTYSYCSSELFSGSERFNYKTEQSLHYIGIPVNLNYKFWNNKKLSAYISAGAMIETCVDGRYNTEYTVDKKASSSKHEKIKDGNLQFSVQSSLGVQYSIMPKVSLFSEVGANYYFDNKSNIETIYKDKPLNMKLKVGFRFTIK